MAKGSTRSGARARPRSTKQTAPKKKTGVVSTGVRRRSSRSAGVITTPVPSGMKSGKSKPRSTVVVTERKRPMYAGRQHEGHVHHPFWSDAMTAYVIEYRENDAKMPGGVWESKVYCSDKDVAWVIYNGCRDITNRAEWAHKTHLAAKGIAFGVGDHFLWRVMSGQRAEKLK